MRLLWLVGFCYRINDGILHDLKLEIDNKLGWMEVEKALLGKTEPEY